MGLRTAAGFRIDGSYRVGFLDVGDRAAEPGPTRPGKIPVILDADIDGDRDDVAAPRSPTSRRKTRRARAGQKSSKARTWHASPPVSDPGPKDRPAYTGFWFYDGLQFDESNRMRRP